jgi:hypothetical protein
MVTGQVIFSAWMLKITVMIISKIDIGSLGVSCKLEGFICIGISHKVGHSSWR